MLVISSVLLLRQQQFNSSTILRSLAYSVALSIHQAQVYGVSIKQDSAGGFAPAYGIYMNKNNPTQYILFADVNGTGQYDPSENIQTFTLNKGYTIAGFCGMSDCTDNAIDWLIIMFRRPNPEACIETDSNRGPSDYGCATGKTSIYSSASIELASQGGSTRTITVSSTGEIDVGGSGSTVE